jgi:hypothetical protein
MSVFPSLLLRLKGIGTALLTLTMKWYFMYLLVIMRGDSYQLNRIFFYIGLVKEGETHARKEGVFLDITSPD